MKNKEEKAVSFFRKNQARVFVMTIIIFIGIVSISSASMIVNPMPNPAAVYCEELGYNYTIKSAPEGDYGICHFPDGSEAEEWKFLEGKEGKEYTYCKQKGYKIKTVSEGCTYGEECAVCVLENGSEIEVTELMELEKEELNKSKETTQDFQKTKDYLFLAAGLIILIVLGIIGVIYYRRTTRAKEGKYLKV